MEVLLVVVLLGGGVLSVAWSLKTKDNPQTPIDTRRRNATRPPVRRRSPATVRGSQQAPPAQNLVLPPIPDSLILTGRAFVIDGDTIRIQKTKIRLAGIDAPELNMPWGQKSKWAMVEICKGQIITVKLDGERSYDRLVGTCYLPDGRDIGAELVRLGLALDLPYFSDGKYRHLEPQGSRKRLANGKFGHASIRSVQNTRVSIQTVRN